MIENLLAKAYTYMQYSNTLFIPKYLSVKCISYGYVTSDKFVAAVIWFVY